MNGAHLHLILNHIPVLGGVLTLLLVGLIYIKKNISLMKWVLVWMVLIGLFTLPTYFSGEPAEEIIEGLLGESVEPFIEEHEEFAFFAMLATEAIALLALWNLIQLYRRRRASEIVWKTITGLAVVNLILMILTSNLGGQIRHTEIRTGFDLKNPNPAAAPR